MLTIENTISTTPTAGARRNGAPQAGKHLWGPQAIWRHPAPQAGRGLPRPVAGAKHPPPECGMRHGRTPQNSSRRF
jgi:hypothetical protein